MTDHSNGSNDQRIYQQWIIGGTVIVVMIYHIVFWVFPQLCAFVGSRYDRYKALKALESKIEREGESTVPESNDTLVKEQIELSSTSEVRFKEPSFQLKFIEANRSHVKSTDKELCNDAKDDTNQCTTVMNGILDSDRASLRPYNSSTAPNQTKRNLTKAKPKYKAVYIPTGKTLSGPLYAPPPGDVILSPLEEERALRNRQDLEYEMSVRADEESARREQAVITEKMNRIFVRRTQLQDSLLPELEEKSTDVIFVSFRYKETAENTTNSVVKRLFHIDVTTMADVFNFIESLELRPLFSDFDLQMNYPKLTFSTDKRETNELDFKLTLRELGITSDSVVWIHFHL